MEEYKVGICDSDTYYVLGFMEYINLNERIPIKIFAFSNIASIEDYMEQEKLDMLLLDEKLEYSNAAVLISELTDIRENSVNKDKIYKYQSVDDISCIIIKKLENQRLHTKKGNYVYGIYSPLGRCGKTNLAKGICNYYKDSLYIGFEAFAGGLQDYTNNYKILHDHFMYYLISENICISEVIEKLEYKDGFKSFITLDSIDLKNITSENIEWLTHNLKENNNYRRVVFDINAGMVDMRVLTSMDKIYVPILKDKVSVDKITRFKKLISDNYNELTSVIHYVTVPDADNGSKEMREFIMKGDI